MAGKHGSGVTTANGTLGERVRSARQALGFSQARLAGDELTKGFISQLESGTVRPSIRSLQIIAARLGKPLDYFLGDEPLATGKRVAFHRLAAETAAEQREWTSVREHVQVALPEATGADRAHLLLLRSRAEIAERAHERAFDLIAEALGLVDVASEPRLVAELLFYRATAYGDGGQIAAASESLEASRDVIERFEILDPRLRSRVLVSLGTTYRRLKRSSKALSAYESALATASRSSELTLAARGYMGIAATHYDAGELDAAIGMYRRALELFRRVADSDFELQALQSIAIVQFENAEYESAQASARRAMDRAIEVGNARWAATAEVTLARIALREARPEDALRKARHAEALLEEAGDRIQQADALGAIGAAHEALGQHTEADRAYRRSLDMYTEVDDLADRSGMATEYAHVLRARGDLDAAFRMLELAQGAPQKP
jgi:HTH-type transcriptional regulator, quorum sensing regulator NprR